MPTKLKIKGNCHEMNGKLKQKYGNLTDDDLMFAEGKEDELLGRLEKSLEKPKTNYLIQLKTFNQILINQKAKTKYR